MPRAVLRGEGNGIRIIDSIYNTRSEILVVTYLEKITARNQGHSESNDDLPFPQFTFIFDYLQSNKKLFSRTVWWDRQDIGVRFKKLFFFFASSFSFDLA